MKPSVNDEFRRVSPERHAPPNLRMPPQVDAKPTSLLGHVVQIALSKDQLRGHTKLIPPLRVVRYVLSKDSTDSSSTETAPLIFFQGIPVRAFLALDEFAEEFSYLTEKTVIMFYSNLDELQPHFCLDPVFLEYLEKEREHIPVEVFVKSSGTKLHEDDSLAYRSNYTYLDFGVLQLFVPRRGFVNPWPSSYPHKEHLARIEQLMLKVDESSGEGAV